MGHDVTIRSFTFNTEAISFIDFFYLSIDFEYFQPDTLGLLSTRRNNKRKQFSPDTLPLVTRMNNDHSNKQMVTSILDMGIPNQLVFLAHQRNTLRIKVSREIVLLPLFIPTPNFRNKAVHYQAIQLVDGFSVCFFSFPIRINHGDNLYA